MEYSWEATTEDVAALLPQRTKGEFGKDGEFRDPPDATTPTKKQVESILSKTAERIADKLNLEEGKDICPNGPLNLAKEVHALRAAMMVELTYFANQLRTDQSPYKALKEEYESGLKDLIEAYENKCGDEGGDIAGEKRPKGNFPRPRRWNRRRY